MSDAIGVVGVGWVGLVTAACFAELGRDVVAMDVDETKVASLNDGQVTMHEPGIGELLERNRERLTFTTEMDDVLARAKLLFCCVDTPPTYSGDADLSRVEAVVSTLGSDGGHSLVMKSTVPAGTGAAIRREHPSLAYVSCPEFLKEGSAVDDFLHPDRVVIGADPGDEWAADAVEDLYRPLGGELVRTDVASAEMIKLASNAFLATKISFINEIANVSEEVGADVTEVARGMGLDKRIGPAFLQAGIGYGGSCFHPGETVLVRTGDTSDPVTFEELWVTAGGGDRQAVAPEGLEVWSWVPGEPEPEWMRVSVLTKRPYEGGMIEVATGDGRRVRVTEDHPFIARAGDDDDVLVRVLANELEPGQYLPATSMPQSAGPVIGDFVPDSETNSPTAVAVVEWTAVAALTRYRGSGPVYSLKVPGSQTVVTSGGLIAGQCFPKDVSALKQLAGNTGYHFQLLSSVIEVNELQKRRVLKKLEKHLGSLAGKRIALLGLAFKPNTDDMREASSLVLSARLQGEGATVSAYDPVAEPRARELLDNVEFATSVEDALDGADAAILVTEWPEFAELDWAALVGRMATPLIVDGRNFLDPATLREAGFAYEGIGRPG